MEMVEAMGKVMVLETLRVAGVMAMPKGKQTAAVAVKRLTQAMTEAVTAEELPAIRQQILDSQVEITAEKAVEVQGKGEEGQLLEIPRLRRLVVKVAAAEEDP